MLERAPSLMAQECISLSESLYDEAKTKHHKNIAHKMNEDNGIEIPINGSSDFIFSEEEVLPHLRAFMGKEVTQGSMAEYLFAENIRKHQIAKKSWKTSVRYCPFLVRLGIYIQAKMGYAGGCCDLLVELAGLPKSRELNQYTIPTSNDPDGILFTSLHH